MSAVSIEHGGQDVSYVAHVEKKIGLFEKLKALRFKRWYRMGVAAAVMGSYFVQPELAVAGLVILGALWANAKQEAKSH